MLFSHPCHCSSKGLRIFSSAEAFIKFCGCYSCSSKVEIFCISRYATKYVLRYLHILAFY